MRSLSFKYHYRNEACVLLEAKVNGLPEGTPIGRVYHWLLYSRSSDAVRRLTFRGMGSEGDRETRAFAEGDLILDAQRAELTMAEGDVEVMAVGSPDGVSDDIRSAVEAFLQQDPGA